MTPFDNYEIHGCRVHAVSTETGVETFAVQCLDTEAEYWTLFGHIPGQGLETIRDFPSRDGAEEAFQRITGIPFGSHNEVGARVRVMHAGPKLLEALEAVKDADYLEGGYQPTLDMVDAAITEATDGKPGHQTPDAHETLLLASAYIQYVKERNPKLHKEADGSPSIEQAVDRATGRRS